MRVTADVETKILGLSAAEVAQRVARGQINRVKRSNWLEYRDIISRNFFTLFNALVVPAAIALFLLEDHRGAFAVSGMAVINTIIGLVQETRAKWALDKLALLVETKARVVRDGKMSEIPAGDVVLGDYLALSTGDAIVADGTVLEAHFLEVDEALLTGESDAVACQPGRKLLSGSYCVAGDGIYRADQVGKDAFAQHTSLEARSYRYSASPLQKSINVLIQVLTYTAVTLCFLYMVMYWLNDFSLREMLRDVTLIQMVAATITSMVPQGLVLMTTIAFTLGALRMSARGALVQRLNAVESMASVDVLCMDKTGTLTTNQLKLDQVKILSHHLSEMEVRERLRVFAWLSVDQKNKNIQAIRSALGPLPESSPVVLEDQLPFKSQNRYSAIRVREETNQRILVMGACESLRPLLADESQPEWESKWRELLSTGLRLLMFAQARNIAPFQGSLQGITLEPLALVALSDELRPEAEQVLRELDAQQIQFKIISGDNPETVRATVAHIPLPFAQQPVVTGDQLDSAPNREELILTRSVFGRVSPHQKVEIVKTLRAAGHHVAMIGDGVNDVLPIKGADLGIAMGEGSSASKTVSGMVLQNNNFTLLPQTLAEGRTIIRNLRRAGKLFLLKNVYTLLLIVGAIGIFNLKFPYKPQQVTLLNLLTIGIPALLITFSKHQAAKATPAGFLHDVGGFAIRTGIVIGIAGLTIFLISANLRGDRLEMQHSLLLSVLILLGVGALLLVLAEPGTGSQPGDVWIRRLAAAAGPIYLLALYLPIAAYYFELDAPGLPEWGLVFAVATPAFFATWILSVWRSGPESKGSAPVPSGPLKLKQ